MLKCLSVTFRIFKILSGISFHSNNLSLGFGLKKKNCKKKKKPWNWQIQCDKWMWFMNVGMWVGLPVGQSEYLNPASWDVQEFFTSFISNTKRFEPSVCLVLQLRRVYQKVFRITLKTAFSLRLTLLQKKTEFV